MNGDDADHFVPEHLAKWRKVTCEYLFVPLAEARREDAVDVEETLRHPAAKGGSSRGLILSWAGRALSHLLKRAAKGEADPLQALENALYFQVSLMAKHPFVPRTLLDWYAHTGDARVRSRIRGVIGHHEKRLSRLIGRAIQQGLVKSNVDAQSAAGVLVGMIQGLALRMNAGISRPEMLLREAATVFSIYLDGIRTFPVSARGAVPN